VHDPGPPPLVRLPDGTVKQRSPLTDTVVWTVPGRAHRLLGAPPAQRHPIDHARDGAHCAFCPGRYRETPPEKERVVRTGDGWRVLRDVREPDLDASLAEFRRIPNLFEILSVDYWRANHGARPSAEARARAEAYLADPGGREHVLAILRRRLASQGVDDAAWAARPPQAWLDEHAIDLFVGTHDVVVARRHFVDGAEHDDELAGSGTLTPDEHHRYVRLTVDAMADLYAAQPAARYVAAFQNWLRPAGASFDHLHKQLVAIDEHGPRADRVLARLREHPGVFDDVVVHAVANGLVIAANAGAVAVAGVGHRYPSVEVYATGEPRLPWEHDDAGVRAVSDLLHAVHAATGVGVPSNEEWHHRPPRATGPMPWHVVVKWRVSTLAGFEGSTKVNVNTLAPDTVRDLVVSRLVDLRAAGAVADVALGDECGDVRLR
jgi:galactose-1-phosphate uridylyltransferase